MKSPEQSYIMAATLKYNKEFLWRLIGPQGSQLKKIEQETGILMTLIWWM